MTAPEKTQLIIRDLRLDMSIGIHSREKERRQSVVVNIVLDTMTPQAWREDRHENVVCYDGIVAAIKAMSQSGHVNLVETFAERIAQYCLEVPGILAAEVRVEKTEIYSGNPGAVGVEILRVRQSP